MKEIQDKALLTHYLQQFHIESFSDTPNLPFHVYEYETGEFLNTIHSPKDYLKFRLWNVYGQSNSPRLNIREYLWQDNRFLQHLIRHICKKVTVTNHDDVFQPGAACDYGLGGRDAASAEPSGREVSAGGIWRGISCL